MLLKPAVGLKVFNALVVIAMFPQRTESKQNLHLEILGHMNQETIRSLHFAANETRTTNSSLNIRIGYISATIGKKDLFEYAASIKDKTVIFMEEERISQRSCIVSGLAGKTLISLKSSPYGLHNMEHCTKVISVSASENSYGQATKEILMKNSLWNNIVILYEMEEAGHVAEIQLQFANEVSSKAHLLLMESFLGEPHDQLLERTWHTIVKMKPQAIIPLIDEHFIKELLQMETCLLRGPLTWLIQGKFPSNLTSAGQHIVLAFQLAVTNSTKTENLHKEEILGTKQQLNDENALLAHDALLLVAKATSDVIRDSRWNGSNSNNSLPTNSDLLREYILKTSIQGVTGVVSINSHMEREVEKLQVLNLQNNKPLQIGEWTASTGVAFTQEMKINFETNICKQPTLRGHTLRISTFKVDPYIMEYTKSDGTIAYKGFCIDILEYVSRDLGFKYVIELSPGNRIGTMINGEWNGMIQILIDKKSDMAVGALTVTAEREKVVDFTIAYQHYTDEMVLARPAEEDNLFIFIDPLSSSIWFCLGGTICFVGLMTYLLNYFCPYGWKDENRQGTSSEFSFFNSLWFSVACILQQGSADRPKSLSGRIFAGVYWFCILIFVSTYTANLAAFFTAKSASTTIKNMEDVLKSDYSVGVTASSALYSFFEKAEFETYQQLWYRMSFRNTFPDSSMQGIEWARTGNYVHITDGPILKYAAIKKPCNLMTVPGLNTPKGLAFALQPGSIYTKNITLSLLRMREQGILDERQNYWWEKQSQCPKYDTNSLESKKVHLKNMVGVYIVLSGGSVLAFFILIVETLWRRKAEQKLALLREKTAKKIRIRGTTD